MAANDYHISPVKTPEQCRRLFDLLSREGLLQFLFYDGAVTEAAILEYWATECRQKGLVDMFVVTAAGSDDPLAFYYKTGFTGDAAFFHFAFFKASKGRRHEIGRLVLAHELTRHSALFGLTPWKHAATFAQEVGFKLLDIAPGVCEFPNHQNRPGYVLAIYNQSKERNINHGWWKQQKT